MKAQFHFLHLTTSLLVLAAFATGEVRAQPLSWSDFNFANKSNIQSLILLPSGRLMAGDESGNVVALDTGTVIWSQVPVAGSTANPAMVTGLAIHPNGHLFAAVGGLYLYTSLDGGEHWNHVSVPSSIAKRVVACTPGGTLFVGSSRMLRSTDEGATWSVSFNLTVQYPSFLLEDPGLLLVGTTTGVYRSTDDGVTWTVADSAFRSRQVRALARSTGGKIYAATDSGAYVSADSGRTWIRGSGISAATAICALPDGHVLAGDGTNGLFKSTDEGLMWTPTGNGPSVNPRCLLADGSGEAFAGGPDGMYRSASRGSDWTKLGRGLTGAKVTATGATSARVVVATKESVIYFATFDGPWSKAAIPPSGTEVKTLSGVVSTVFLAGTLGAGIFRTTDGCDTWVSANAGLTDPNVHSIIVRTPALVFAGTDGGVFRSLDSGKTWSDARDGLPAYAVRALGAWTGTPLYAGTAGGGIYRSSDDGASWIAVNAGLPGLDVRSLVVGPDGSLLGGVEGSGVFFSSDGGSSWNSASAGLPDLSVRKMISNSTGAVFAATASGVFKALAPGSGWVADTTGLPASGPTDIALVLDQYLICSTDGSGIQIASTEPTVPPQLPITNWMSVGSLHNWYSAMGSEMEEGRFPDYQDGMRWPAIMPHQDMQVSRALWIGTANYTDAFGTYFPRKVVHVGPRAKGTGEFIPMSFVTSSKFTPPTVTVNGGAASLLTVTNDAVDPTLTSDRSITNDVNTSIGISMRRKILQFSHPLHDNYIVQEYEFTNTGNIDADPFIEQPSVTLDSVYFYFLSRWAICADVRYVIGNSTGWGRNTMLDGRGDGVMVDPPGEGFRAQFGWHGRFPPFMSYDNLGGPIWDPYVPYQGSADTTGRLGAPQFTGVVTLHADQSASNHADDPLQPRTTSWESSDDPETEGNNQYDRSKMTQEYTWMTRGHKSPRHAWQVEPLGNFDQPTGDPALQTPGGFSAASGYGPYRLGPGDTVRIAIAEGTSGLDIEARQRVGQLYKHGAITARAKNDSVLSGRDSLFQTFRRALANHGSGYNLPVPPFPPREVQIRSGDLIRIDWQTFDGGPRVNGFRLYRAEESYGNPYEMIAELGSAERSFRDSTSTPGKACFYYLVAVGDSLSSGRYYTQTFVPAYRTVVGVGVDRAGIPDDFFLERNYPNPFNPFTIIRYGLPIRSRVTLTVFNTLGQQVAEVVNGELEAGYHEVRFDGSGLASGVYFYRLRAVSFVETKKLLLLR